MTIQYNLFDGKSETKELKFQWGIFTFPLWGDFSQIRSKDAPVDDVTTAWLAKVCNDTI